MRWMYSECLNQMLMWDQHLLTHRGIFFFKWLINELLHCSKHTWRKHIRNWSGESRVTTSVWKLNTSDEIIFHTSPQGLRTFLCNLSGYLFLFLTYSSFVKFVHRQRLSKVCREDCLAHEGLFSLHMLFILTPDEWSEVAEVWQKRWTKTPAYHWILSSYVYKHKWSCTRWFGEHQISLNCPNVQ